MRKACLLYTSHYKLGLTYDQLGRHLQRERKLAPARQCFALARQYKENAAQLERARREAAREMAAAQGGAETQSQFCLLYTSGRGASEL